MDNEERIRRWQQQQRGGRPASGQVVADDALARGRPQRGEVADAPPAASPAPQSREPATVLPDEYALEEARLAIQRRRQERWRRTAGRLVLFLAVPLLAVLLYVTLVATKLYEGEAAFTVQTSNNSAVSPTAGVFALGSGGTTLSDAFKAREYILSRPMMERMEQEHGFLRHFETWRMDPLTRFRSPLGLNQDPYAYYRKRVRVAVDVQEGLLRLYVQARTPEDAIRFGNAILAASEAHVNAFSEKISTDQIAALTRDVQSAERQVSDARRSLATVQAQRGELSPEQTATAVYQLISSLELQLAEARRERNSLLDQGLTDSPLLPRLNGRIQDLTAQIAEQRSRLASPSGNSLVRTASEFENAAARKEIAQARWQSTLNTLQQAYLRILDQRRYFVIVVGMSAAAFPKVRDFLTIMWPILFLVLLTYALAWVFRSVRGERPLGSRGSLADWTGSWRSRWAR